MGLNNVQLGLMGKFMFWLILWARNPTCWHALSSGDRRRVAVSDFSCWFLHLISEFISLGGLQTTNMDEIKYQQLLPVVSFKCGRWKPGNPNNRAADWDVESRLEGLHDSDLTSDTVDSCRNRYKTELQSSKKHLNVSFQTKLKWNTQIWIHPLDILQA